MQKIKKFKQYIEFTKTTAVYPKDQALEYLTFGMIDETFELKDKITYSSNIREVVDECSDICWYVAQLCDLLDVNINEERRNTSHFININHCGEHLVESEKKRLLDDMLNRMGMMCGYIKKYIRDENEEKIKDFKSELLFIINRLQHLAPQIGAYNLQNVLQINVNKLTDRKDRGVLKGDGDNR